MKMVKLGKLSIRLEEIDAYFYDARFNNKKSDYFELYIVMKNGNTLKTNCINFEELAKYVSLLDNYFLKEVVEE